MAKSKLITTQGLSLQSETPIIGQKQTSKPVPKISQVKPCGATVLVEVLTEQEMLNTSLTLSSTTKIQAPLQGYIRAVGPAFKASDYGFDIGDRVLISGAGVMSPNYDNSHRDRYFMEPYAIKSILVES
jgi:co-chaperonin GroES (HSP10)